MHVINFRVQHISVYVTPPQASNFHQALLCMGLSCDKGMPVMGVLRHQWRSHVGNFFRNERQTRNEHRCTYKLLHSCISEARKEGTVFLSSPTLSQRYVFLSPTHPTLGVFLWCRENRSIHTVFNTATAGQINPIGNEGVLKENKSKRDKISEKRE